MRSTLRSVARGGVAGASLLLVLVFAPGTTGAASTCTIVANPTDTNYTSCPGADLEGANLSNVDLDYADFHGANLSGANLSNSSLRWASLANTQLGSTNLRSADLYEASLYGANAPAGANLSYANLNWADLDQSKFTDDTAQHTDFDEAYLPGATFSGTVLSGSSFSHTFVLPSIPFVEAASESGAEVSYTTSSSSPVPGIALTTCSPAPGFFPVGYDTVVCGVVDDYGDSASGIATAVVGLPSVVTAQPALVSASGNTLAMTARLTDGISGAPVGGAEIWFWAFGARTPTCTAQTDATGTATCTLSSASAAFAMIVAGGYTAYYNGFDTPTPYFPSQARAGLAG